MNDPLAPSEGASWFTIWARATRAAYKLAYGERSALVRGKRTRSYDDRGLHPYSEQWGRMTLAESFVMAETGWLPYLSPASLRDMAHADAHHDYVKELREESDV